MKDQLRQQMFRELEQKDILEQVKEYSYQYLDEVMARRVFPDEESLKNLAEFDESLPENIGDASAIIAQLNQYGAAATVTHIAGRYFGFVNGSVLPTAMAARLLADVWDQNSALYVISPLAAKLESICEGWLRSLFNLPDHAVAGFVSGSSLAIFCGLAAGRYRVFDNLGWDINQKGFYGAPKVRLVVGRQAHGTVMKAIAMLGFGLDHIEWVDCDDQGRIIADQVPPLDSSTILVLQAGHVCSGAFDPFAELCAKARKAGAWVHVDGAFGLWAGATKKLSHLTAGMQEANSFSLDGHKTLNTPYDNGIVLCDDKEALTKALHASGSYIVHSEQRDGMFYTPEMSRRARGIELWAALKYLGKQGIDDLVYGFHVRAKQAAEALAEAGFQILNEVVFNQVMVRCETDELTQATMQYLQQSGECWVGGAQWQGRPVIRISVCSWATTAADIERTVTAFIQARADAET